MITIETFYYTQEERERERERVGLLEFFIVFTPSPPLRLSSTLPLPPLLHSPSLPLLRLSPLSPSPSPPQSGVLVSSVLVCPTDSLSSTSGPLCTGLCLYIEE